ncbi:MAG: multiheme c-type cytochrome [Gammaproteobacteria bacterium]|nr:multiheme c-type cytochrome [Gammaproteobacteria bacterium]
MFPRAAVPVVLAFAVGGCDRLAGPAADSVPGSGAQDAASAALPPPAYAGGAVCADCHAEQAASWRGSHHDLAMQPATAATVLGDFAATEFSAYGENLRFFEQDGVYRVAIEAGDGAVTEHRIAWTFGVSPLQQYLIELDAGRVQALSVAWDTRPAADGGQRWFHLYDEPIAAGDPLHWTGTYQRWNTMCADCHSTDFVKNYDRDADRFDSRFASVNVDCEACHGPSANHVANPAVPPPALGATERSWAVAAGARIASLVDGAVSGEIEVCAQCHSRRVQLTDVYEPEDALLDAYRPVLLDAGLYHADGQILDEVYVYGSFLQSKMARAGVQCSDCHDPHSAGLIADGNALCARCHVPTEFDTPAHHRHEQGTAAAECVSCHMRAETYMVVDPRRDHSFRVPRPDLSSTLGSPNACNDCHSDQPSDWAATAIADWFPGRAQTRPHFGEALHAGRTWAAEARVLLTELIADPEQPAIARASAIELLGRWLTPADVPLLEQSLDDASPLVQLAAIDAAFALAPNVRIDLLQRFLTDDRLALRTAAARSLLTARAGLSPRRQLDLDAAVAEYLDAQDFSSDRPEAWLNLGAVAADRNRSAEAESFYVRGIERFPFFGALYINLADLYRVAGREDDAERVLRDGLTASPDDAAIVYALALALVRADRLDEALAAFERAAELGAGEPRYRYAVALARNDVGDNATALSLLEALNDEFPGHPDTLFALATIARDAGDLSTARRHAEALAALRPGDAAALSLLAQIEQLQTL